MLFFLIVSLLLFTAYSILMMMYLRAWKSVPVFKPAGEPVTRVSIIIPARNEEQNIGRLLTAITTQNFPPALFEIIVIDDHSKDGTARVAGEFHHVRVISLSGIITNSYKKRAIEAGIAATTGELVITTDADCVPAPNWLRTMVLFYQQQNSAFIAAPVAMTTNHSFLSIFQAMDFMILQGITAGAVQKKIHAMCNGANMAYTRDAFIAVGGFSGIDHIASGDDMLLMYKIRAQYPDRVHYLLAGEAIMRTSPQPTLRSFINQRIRWASKATHYQEKNLMPVLLLVYGFNVLFLVLAVTSVWLSPLWWLLAALWAGKTLAELPFFLAVSRFYHLRRAAALLLLFQPIHIAYTILSGLLGQLRTYEWKGRKVS